MEEEEKEEWWGERRGEGGGTERERALVGGGGMWGGRFGRGRSMDRGEDVRGYRSGLVGRESELSGRGQAQDGMGWMARRGQKRVGARRKGERGKYLCRSCWAQLKWTGRRKNIGAEIG